MKEKRNRYMRSNNWFWSVLSFSLILLACDSSRIFDKNTALGDAGWPADEAMAYEFDIEATDVQYNFLLNVRNTSDYPYSNLFLFIEMSSPDEKYYADTLEFTLADNTGRWLGSGIGSTWQHQFPLLEGVKLLVPGTYIVRVKHGMRNDTLQAISDVGLRVEIAK